ncbi:FAD-binding oxidoreductase [Winogradskyella sp.]|nr:FAD-binding oxidoreductase [Winogradskyella sp.]MDC0009057.1 FAD-binding oxidoreductase [Winogradskyella sp.]MDC1503736.1 FAD-binding oxidoreductase [Winogradskyella sp.]
MNLSYWEIQSWLTNIDYTIVGSGIVGLNCALQLRKRFSKSKILVLEKGMLPQGASTKNAGFACFGSISEIIDDLNHHTKEEVLELIKKRVKGLQLLRETLGDKAIDYQNLGGYELFLDADNALYELCIAKQETINKLLRPIFKSEVFSTKLTEQSVKPARAQVLITKPIKDLPIKGTFHLDEGYYYFRNINNRILFGGGRNLDFKTEETTTFGKTEIIQNKLEELLRTTILPNTAFKVDHRWSGIMGVGSQKKAIVKQLSNHVYCGVRLGGMVVAIGSTVGKELVSLVK